MSKELSEALGEVLALVEKATERTWEHVGAGLVLHDPDVSVYCGHIATFVEDDDAEAAAASINFLRQHGPAIAAALRAVEGDAVDAARYRWLRDDASKVKGMSPAVIYATEHFDVSSDECGGFEYGPDLDAAIDKARGVPLDAAGSAEGD